MALKQAQCAWCKALFEWPTSALYRSLRKGAPLFCGRACVALARRAKFNAPRPEPLDLPKRNHNPRPDGVDPALYRLWVSIRQRCNNSDNREYQDYGGRGIRVCPAWGDYDRFVADVGPRPSARHSFDRINNDGNYEPGNVRWASQKQQNNNRRVCIYVADGAERVSLTEYCDRKGLIYDRVWGRMKRGWAFSDAVSKPPRRCSRWPSTWSEQT